ncbi:MAG: flagellar export chaperone FliS [Pseudomonadota bacterium]|jgi:flagellar biosynthetic protein FliS
MQQNPAQAYLQRQVEQATPLQTLLMLMDGMIKFTQHAKDAIGRGEIEARYHANRRAMEITTFLLSQQDPNQKQAYEPLHRILLAIQQRQMQIDFKNTPEACDEVMALMRQLRAGFSSLQSARVVAGPEPASAPKPLAATA